MILRRCPQCDHVRLEGPFTVCTQCQVLTWPGRRIRLGSVGAAVLARLAVSRRAVSTNELVDWVYGDDEDGGPLWAADCIRNSIHTIRRRTRHLICPFRVMTHGRGIGYSILLNSNAAPLTDAVHTHSHVGEARLPAGTLAMAGVLASCQAPALFLEATR